MMKKLFDLIESEDPEEASPNTQRDNNQAEDESGLEIENDRGPEIEVPFDPSKIDIIVKPMTISALEDRLENNELDLTPEFQRQANIWDITRKSRLIESVLLRIPLPSFYFSEDKDGSYAVVDGLQRLCAIFHFMSYSHLNKTTGSKLTPLHLVSLQYLKELSGKSFADLDRKFKRRISELEITANIIRANTPSAVKFNVFARLNQGGMPLNAQEIRNAIFPGVWRSKLKEMAEGKTFLKVTERKIKTQRQEDMELVLRFIALWQIGHPYRRPLNKTLDEFLNTTVENVLIKWNDEKWMEASKAFERALLAAQAIFGKVAFRKSVDPYYRTPINRGLFEAQLISLSNFGDTDLVKLKKQKDRVIEEFANALLESEDFNRALLYATGSAESSNIRIQKFGEIFGEAINA